MPTPTRHRVPSLLRIVLAAVLLAGAPVSMAAEPTPAPSATDDPQTSVELEAEIARAKAEQEALAKALAEQQRQIEELEALQAELKGQLDQTASQLKQVTADLTAVRAEIEAMVLQIEQVQARYEELVVELARLDAELADLIVKEERKARELRERQLLLADRMRAAYDADRTSLLEMFLSGRSFSDILAEVSYHLDVGAQDQALGERIRADQEILEALRVSVELARTETNIVRQETAAQKRQLDRDLRILEETRAQLALLEEQTAAELKLQQEQLDRLGSSKEDLEAAIARHERARGEVSASISRLVAAQAALGHIPSEYNGTFIWPLTARISQEWGCSSYTGYGPGGPGCMHFHNGIDIVSGQCEADVVAAGDGVVAYHGWNYADGLDPAWIVVIAHSTGLKTWYAHLQAGGIPGIAEGVAVKQGDLIGIEGNTGHSSGCHLHWMVELDGSFVNPRLFL